MFCVLFLGVFIWDEADRLINQKPKTQNSCLPFEAKHRQQKSLPVFLKPIYNNTRSIQEKKAKKRPRKGQKKKGPFLGLSGLSFWASVILPSPPFWKGSEKAKGPPHGLFIFGLFLAFSWPFFPVWSACKLAPYRRDDCTTRGGHSHTGGGGVWCVCFQSHFWPLIAVQRIYFEVVVGNFDFFWCNDTS